MMKTQNEAARQQGGIGAPSPRSVCRTGEPAWHRGVLWVRTAVRPAISMVLIAFVAAVVPHESECDSHDTATRGEPGTHSVPYDPRWTTVERRVWSHLSAGQKVDLSGPCPDWWSIDSQPSDERDPATYTISGAFVTQLMAEPRYRTAAENLPIMISGARISGDVLVRGGRSERSLTLTCSVIDGDLRILERDMGGQVNLYTAYELPGTLSSPTFVCLRALVSCGVMLAL